MDKIRTDIPDYEHEGDIEHHIAYLKGELEDFNIPMYEIFFSAEPYEDYDCGKGCWVWIHCPKDIKTLIDKVEEIEL